jgi:hypothetical protein
VTAVVICPVALAVGCKRCPVFAVCPATTLLGDQKPAAKDEAPADKPAADKGKRSRRPRRK